MMIVFFATLASLIGIAVAVGMSSWDHIKANWNDYRCDPRYMAFAHYANPKTTGAENFTYCLNQMSGNIWRILIDQIYTYFGVVANSLGEIQGPLDSFRGVFSNIRKFMLSYTTQALSKVTATTSVFTHYIIKIRDVLKRFVAEGYIGAALIQTMVDFVWSFVTLAISIIKGFVYALLAISIILALFQPALLILAITLAALIGAAGF